MSRIRKLQPIQNHNINRNGIAVQPKNETIVKKEFLNKNSEQTSNKTKRKIYIAPTNKNQNQKNSLPQKIEVLKQQQNELSRCSQLKNKNQNDNYPITVLLGVPGVGKTQIMHKLFPNEQQIKEFSLYKLKDLQQNFVDTTGFDFEGDIEQREAQIKKYQELFVKYANEISQLIIVVNFERTDLMKKKLISVYKYFRKFSNILSIIVTDFHLSESNQDKEHLKKNFKIFKPNDILFLRGNATQQELKEQLKNSKILNKIIPSQQLCLKDTIFELEDLNDQNNLRKQLFKMINK